ncbi:MAG TPA: PIG-L family deacetylase [Thermoanaerobaculia bacterium]|nr:PIG-L family deacetylase [Thermoanaerobaculia bacterium]
MPELPPLDRLLVIAPHPDDEAIPVAGLIQRALAGGGRVRVVYLTDGEHNIWPQRVLLRRWRIRAEDLAAWGALRRREALASLRILGAREEDAAFLGFPDAQLSMLARIGDTRVTSALAAIATAFAPTLIISPSCFDLHGDHRAGALFAHRAAGQTPILTYMVHGDGPPERLAAIVPLTEAMQAKKRDAVMCHASQLILGRRRFLSHVRVGEPLYTAEHDIVRVDNALHGQLARLRHALLAVTGRRKR